MKREATHVVPRSCKSEQSDMEDEKHKVGTCSKTALLPTEDAFLLDIRTRITESGRGKEFEEGEFFACDFNGDERCSEFVETLKMCAKMSSDLSAELLPATDRRFVSSFIAVLQRRALFCRYVFVPSPPFSVHSIAFSQADILSVFTLSRSPTKRLEEAQGRLFQTALVNESSSVNSRYR